MAKLTINGKEVEVENGLTLIQACEIAGVEIPRYCYHERLSVAGNCRMCLVQIEKMPKPVASCAMPVADGMIVHTNNEYVRKAREGVMEFLLINHPLDCPICDQAGECDLQDQAMAYGAGSSRYKEPKRSVPEKNFGPLIKTFMNRCIHCTRCIRFSTEIAGVEELGATSRGEHMEIGTYVEKSLSSELSGNLIDICPVGALTNKPYSFRARPWELKKIESIDVMDAVGSNIVVQVRGKEVMRILPKLNEDINEEWISDKTRFACDGLLSQRLDRPYIKRDGKLEAVSFDEAFRFAAEKLKAIAGSKVAAIIGDLCDAESITVLKGLMENIGSANLECRQDGSKIENKNRSNYIFNTTIAGIEQADVCLIIGSNPRAEAAILNARIRKRWLAGGFKVAMVGPFIHLNYTYEHLGDRPEVLEEILSGKHDFAKKLKNAKNPMIILGSHVLTRKDGLSIAGTVSEIVKKFKVARSDWNGFNLLQRAASRVGALDLGFVPGKGGKDLEKIYASAATGEIEAAYLLGADEIEMEKLGNAFVIYQGHHGDKGAHRADVIFPGAAYTEKNATYVNLEGRVQRSTLAVFPPGEAREDWKIITEFSEYLGKKLEFETIKDVRKRMAEINPVFTKIDVVEPSEFKEFGKATKMTTKPFEYPVENFYMTDSISRASKTMAECTAEFVAKNKGQKAA